MRAPIADLCSLRYFGLVTGTVLLLLRQQKQAKPAARGAGVELDPLIGVDALGVSG